MYRKVIYFLKEMSKIVLSIAILMFLVSMSLYLLKKIPAYIKERDQTFYSSVEEAEYSLKRRILVPSYFPDYLVWPPKEIKVLREPSLIITLVFISQGDVGPSLVIHQIISNEDKNEGVGLDFMEPKIHSRQTRVSIGESKGMLKIGALANGDRWIQLSWKEADRKMILISNRSVEDLLRIAGSIHN